MAVVRHLTRRGLLVAAALLGAASCLSPTLPLPPPARPEVSSPDGAGFVRVQGIVQSEASVFVENLRTKRISGQTTEEDGRYEVELGASIGDRLAIWYMVGTDESPSIEIVVPASGPGPGLGGAGGSD